ncbi:hypothetical protein Ade02nite_31640 [Paractinoplanes deccanensis]|uniref:Uncharacterized protein n=1 Tax=Paractinoplanes deccanensis TaxID=113561 RepID=A0ABQ3Y3I1_9ACTN|nr:hypothetical protein Ade02nite_31640 [Actinoplanes deccanensis]
MLCLGGSSAAIPRNGMFRSLRALREPVVSAERIVPFRRQREEAVIAGDGVGRAVAVAAGGGADALTAVAAEASPTRSGRGCRTRFSSAARGVATVALQTFPQISRTAAVDGCPAASPG